MDTSSVINAEALLYKLRIHGCRYVAFFLLNWCQCAWAEGLIIMVGLIIMPVKSRSKIVAMRDTHWCLSHLISRRSRRCIISVEQYCRCILCATNIVRWWRSTEENGSGLHVFIQDVWGLTFISLLCCLNHVALMCFKTFYVAVDRNVHGFSIEFTLGVYGVVRSQGRERFGDPTPWIEDSCREWSVSVKVYWMSCPTEKISIFNLRQTKSR